MSDSNQNEIIMQSVVQDMHVMAERIRFLEATLGKLIEGLASVGILQVDEDGDQQEASQEKESLIVTP